MFFMKNAAQQALDINIGRVLEMLLSGVLSHDQAHDAMTKFFDGAVHKDPTDLHAYLTRMIHQVDKGHVKTDTARAHLVRVALASEKNDPHLSDIIHEMAG